MMEQIPISVQLIRDVFDVEDIDKIWDYLHVKFHFNLKGWKAEWESDCRRMPREIDKQEYFLQFGKKKIEPLLNEVLKRERYPTWIGLVTYVLRDKIERRRKVYEEFRNRYGSENGR